MYLQVFDFRNTSRQQEGNIHKTQEKCTEYHILRLPKDRRTHLVDQMGASRHKSPRITTSAHMPASQSSAEPRRLPGT
jgi:hypothetical protein